IVGKSIEYYGEYLRGQVDLLARLMSTDSVVVEVGPGVGMHVLSLAPAINGGGHFYLYEAGPLLRQMLEHNLSANGISNVTVMKRALSGTTVMRTVAEDSHGTDPIEAPSFGETIDDLHLDVLNWIKIDAEADAKTILRDAGGTLW